MSIELIRAKQQELAAAKAAAEKAAQDRKDAARRMFADTGIPAMWEQIKDIQVPHWRGNGSRAPSGNHMPPVSLAEHAKDVSDTAIQLTDWDGAVKIGWYAEATDKGAIWLRTCGREGRAGDIFTVEAMRDHFVEYMARFLPPLEKSNA